MSSRLYYRFLKTLSLALAFLIGLTSFMTVSAEPASAESKVAVSAMQAYVEAMQPGWNLGNTFDATGNETSWGNPLTTKELIDNIAAAGYKSIRIPITWRQRVNNDNTINQEFLDRIKEVVDWSLDAGLYVMINLHHDSSWIGKMETQHDEVMDRFSAIWKQISATFKDYPEKLMLESINEPRFSEDWGEDKAIYFDMLDELNTTFHKIVRGSGGNNAKRPLVLPTVTCSPSQARMDELVKTMTKLKDKNLIATVHYYGYYPFSVNMAGGYKFDGAAMNDVVTTFDRAYNTFVANGVPVIIGEYGLLGFDTSLETIQHGEMLKYFEFVGYYAHERKMTTMLWDNGQHYKRRDLHWVDEDLYRVMKAGFEGGRSSSTELDSIYIQNSADLADVAVHLNLNGNSFKELKLEDRTLASGTDYEVDGDRLVLKAGLLQSLMKDELGEQATLTCVFSGGADWKLHVIRYETPRLKSFDGSSYLFTIPTAFGGDRLATMTAVYADGGNAGAASWTPFKQYDYAFVPDYKLGTINLKNEFFKETRDGEMLLKFIFWSGEEVAYTITKTGSSVAGVSSNEPEEPAVVEERSVGDDAGDGQQDGIVVESGSVQIGPLNNEPDNNNSWLIITGIVVVVLLGAGAAYYAIRRRRR